MKNRFFRLITAVMLAFGLSAGAALAADPTALTVISAYNLETGVPTAGQLTTAYTAADVANGNSFIATGREVVSAWNTDVANPYTFTVTSVAINGRTGNITTYSLAAAEHATFLVPIRGFRQSTGKVLISGSNAAIKFMVLRLP